MGEFGGRVAQVRQTNINNVGAGVGEARAKAFGAVTTALEGIATKMLANDKLDAENELFDYQAGLDDINNQVTELYSTGKIDYKQMPEMRQKMIDELPGPSFDNLDKLERKRFLLEKKKLLHANKLGMVKQYGLAMQNAAQSSVDKYVTNADKLVQQPNANLEETANNLFANQDFQQTGQFGYENGWQPQQNEIYQRLTSTFVQSQMKHASDAGDIKSLQTIRSSLVDDKQFSALTPLAKKQFTHEVDALIDITTGKSYGKKLVSNFSQLIEKTGDFSAIKAYQAFSFLQNNDLTDTNNELSMDSAKNLAKAAGIAFDKERFSNDPHYLQELQQNHFSQALDQYGSPLMASLAMQVGDKKLNQWIQQFGDPSKDQISEEDFIAKVPDKGIKQTMQKIGQQLKESPADQLNIEASLAAIDNDKSLNSNQKRYAKAEFRQYAESVQQQLQTAYRENHQSVWRDIYINKIPLSEIEPQRLTNLTSEDQANLLDSPKKSLDLALFSEAKGRVKAGDDFNILKDYGNKLPVNQLEQLLGLQQDLTSNPDKKNYFTSTTAMVKDRSKLLGITDQHNINRLNDGITEEIAELENSNGRKATQQEIQNIADKQILKTRLDRENYLVTNKEANGNTVALGTTELSQISENNRKRIVQALKQNGLEVTDENILKAYSGVKNGYTN